LLVHYQRNLPQFAIEFLTGLQPEVERLRPQNESDPLLQADIHNLCSAVHCLGRTQGLEHLWLVHPELLRGRVDATVRSWLQRFAKKLDRSYHARILEPLSFASFELFEQELRGLIQDWPLLILDTRLAKNPGHEMMVQVLEKYRPHAEACLQVVAAAFAKQWKECGKALAAVLWSNTATLPTFLGRDLNTSPRLEARRG